jgi:hypothetical protein
LSHDTHGGSFLNPERSQPPWDGSRLRVIVLPTHRKEANQDRRTLDRRVTSRPCVGLYGRCGVVSGRGMPRGDLITMCHVVVCDPPSDNESGRDPCLSDATSRVGILAFQTVGLRLPRAANLVSPNGLVLRWIRSAV